jgi:hypothetical protein
MPFVDALGDLVDLTEELGDLVDLTEELGDLVDLTEALGDLVDLTEELGDLVDLTEALGDLVLPDFNCLSSSVRNKRVPAVTGSVNSTRRRRTDVVVAKIAFMIGADNKYLKRNNNNNNSNKRKEQGEAVIVTSEEAGGTGIVDYDWSGGHTCIESNILQSFSGATSKKMTILCL